MQKERDEREGAVLYGPQRNNLVLELKKEENRIAVCGNECYGPIITVCQGARMGELSDRREARRFVMTLPVRVMARDGGSHGSELKAHTRDVSYRGLYFLAEGEFEKGNEIDFVLTLPQQVISAGDVSIKCHGHVVRVESTNNGKVGIAAKIDKYEFVPLRASAA